MDNKETLLKQTEDMMKKTIDKFNQEISGIRTERATTSLFDEIKVECYNTVMPINQLANIVVIDTKTIEIRPWDVSILQNIEKAIFQSSLGITPLNDGKVIRLTIPPLTEERRKNIVKQCHKITEDFRVSIRNERRIAMETVKKFEKEKKITEDEKYKLEEKLNKLVDIYIKKINEILSNKEKELLQV